jgi:signal transduction histidine kinase
MRIGWKIHNKSPFMEHHRIKVLFVEDSAAYVRLISYDLATIKNFPLEIYVAERLDEALEKLRAETIDVAVLDLNLPDSMGFSTFTRVQSEFPKLPIVVLTGNEDEAIGVEAIRLGVQDYLAKGGADGKLVARAIRYAIERKHMEERIKTAMDALDESNAKLQERNRLKSEFVAMVSHELRTPLTSIIGFSKTLRSVPLTQEQHARYLEIIEFEGKRLSGIIEEYLYDSKIELGEFTMSAAPADLSAMAAKVIDKYKIIKGNVFQNRIPMNISPVLVDEGRIIQVLGNLVDNAIKYGNPDSTIILSAIENPTIVCVSVSDNGPGIEKEALRRIFDKGFRVRNEDTRSKRGSGLGLFIAKSIILAHNGEIWAESETGKGTTFSFSLPKVRT